MVYGPQPPNGDDLAAAAHKEREAGAYGSYAEWEQAAADLDVTHAASDRAVMRKFDGATITDGEGTRPVRIAGIFTPGVDGNFHEWAAAHGATEAEA